MNNNNPFVLLLTVYTAISFIWGSSCLTGVIGLLPPLRIETAMAQNDNANTSTTNQTNSSITLGNPVFIERDKITPPKPVVVNDTHGLQASYTGSGAVKGVNFSANGTVFIVPRSDNGSSDLIGHADITTTDGEKGTYKFYSLGHTDNATGSTSDNGVVFFHTNSSGKLRIVKDLVIVFKDQNDKAGNGMTVGWEWK